MHKVLSCQATSTSNFKKRFQLNKKTDDSFVNDYSRSIQFSSDFANVQMCAMNKCLCDELKER